MSFSIDGRTAIVTGAASGVGLSVARHFLDQGANVVFADIDEKKLKTELGTNTKNAILFAGDFRQKLARKNLLSATIDEFERIDILVNGSRQFMEGDALEPGTDTLETMLQQNFVQHYGLCKTIAERFKQQSSEEGFEHNESGAIVNISTVAAARSHPRSLAYSVSCAALDQFTKSLAVALAKHRIRVNSVAFGSILSSSLQKAVSINPGLREQIQKGTPLGRIADADNVAEAVHFLASSGANFITGQILTIDGGRSLLDSVDSPIF
ncbi:MAG: SDR family oxidoreductase [Albidovulum sp.]|nr:SDR family oxidoreductase [Albidovulum sp.]